MAVLAKFAKSNCTHTICHWTLVCPSAYLSACRDTHTYDSSALMTYKTHQHFLRNATAWPACVATDAQTLHSALSCAIACLQSNAAVVSMVIPLQRHQTWPASVTLHLLPNGSTLLDCAFHPTFPPTDACVSCHLAFSPIHTPSWLFSLSQVGLHGSFWFASSLAATPCLISTALQTHSAEDHSHYIKLNGPKWGELNFIFGFSLVCPL